MGPRIPTHMDFRVPNRQRTGNPQLYLVIRHSSSAKPETGTGCGKMKPISEVSDSMDEISIKMENWYQDYLSA